MDSRTVVEVHFVDRTEVARIGFDAEIRDVVTVKPFGDVLQLDPDQRLDLHVEAAFHRAGELKVTGVPDWLQVDTSRDGDHTYQVSLTPSVSQLSPEVLTAELAFEVSDVGTTYREVQARVPSPLVVVPSAAFLTTRNVKSEHRLFLRSSVLGDDAIAIKSSSKKLAIKRQGTGSRHTLTINLVGGISQSGEEHVVVRHKATGQSLATINVHLSVQ